MTAASPRCGDVLEHYDAFFKLGLSEREKTELTEYLKTL